METAELEDDITTGAEDASVITPTPPPAPPANDDLRSAMAELAGTVTKLATPKPEVRQESPEQLAERWGVYNPETARKDFFQKFFRLNPDATPDEISEAKGLFADMQKGLVRQAVISARNLYQEELAKLREEFTPIREHVEQARAEKRRNDFFSSYPALRDSDEPDGLKYSGVVEAVARSLAGQDFPNEAAFFKALAEGAAERIKGLVPTFDLGAVAKTKPTAGTSPRLPRTSVGGTGGAGSGGGAKPTKKSDDSDSIDW